MLALRAWLVVWLLSPFDSGSSTRSTCLFIHCWDSIFGNFFLEGRLASMYPHATYNFKLWFHDQPNKLAAVVNNRISCQSPSSFLARRARYVNARALHKADSKIKPSVTHSRKRRGFRSVIDGYRHSYQKSGVACFIFLLCRAAKFARSLVDQKTTKHYKRQQMTIHSCILKKQNISTDLS